MADVGRNVAEAPPVLAKDVRRLEEAAPSHLVEEEKRRALEAQEKASRQRSSMKTTPQGPEGVSRMYPDTPGTAPLFLTKGGKWVPWSKEVAGDLVNPGRVGKLPGGQEVPAHIAKAAEFSEHWADTFLKLPTSKKTIRGGPVPLESSHPYVTDPETGAMKRRQFSETTYDEGKINPITLGPNVGSEGLSSVDPYLGDDGESSFDPFAGGGLSYEEVAKRNLFPEATEHADEISDQEEREREYYRTQFEDYAVDPKTVSTEGVAEREGSEAETQATRLKEIHKLREMTGLNAETAEQALNIAKGKESLTTQEKTDEYYKTYVDRGLQFNRENMDLRDKQKALVDERAKERHDWNITERKHEAEQDVIKSNTKQKLETAWAQYNTDRDSAKFKARQLLENLDNEGRLDGWDYFRRSAIGVGAVLAAAGTVFGAAVFGKKGIPMPNVLMPFVMKAIDADINSIKEGKQQFINDAGAHIDYAKFILNDFTKHANHLSQMKVTGLQFWKDKIAQGRARLSADSQKTLDELEDKMTMEQNKLMQEAENAEAAAIIKNVNSIKEGAKVEAQTARELTNEEYVQAQATELSLRIKNLKAKPESGLDKLPTKQFSLVNESIGMLQEASRLKHELADLFEKTSNSLNLNVSERATLNLAALEEFATRPTTDSADKVTVDAITKKLRMLSRKRGTSIEGRGLTGEDAIFYEGNLMLDLDRSSIATVISAVAHLEYYEKLMILTNLSMLTPKARAIYDTPIALITNKRAEDVWAAFEHSIEGNRLAETPVAFEVGVVPLNSDFIKNDQVLDKIVNRWRKRITSPAMSDGNGRPTKEEAREEQENIPENMVDVSNEIAPMSRNLKDFRKVATNNPESFAYIHKRFHPRWLQLKALAAMEKPPIKLQLEGRTLDGQLVRGHSRAGARSAKDIAEMEAQEMRVAKRGDHTVYGGFTGIDIMVGGSRKSREYKFLVAKGYLVGLERAHVKIGEKGYGGKGEGSQHFRFGKIPENLEKYNIG